MRSQKIFVSSRFQKQFKDLPFKIQEKAAKAEALFSENPLHPSLRLHKLKGKFKKVWSISLDRSYRILFKPQKEGEILFFSIGKHSIYEENL